MPQLARLPFIQAMQCWLMVWHCACLQQNPLLSSSSALGRQMMVQLAAVTSELTREFKQMLHYWLQASLPALHLHNLSDWTGFSVMI